MKTVDVFAVKEERVQRAGQILIVGRLLHTLGPVVRYELHPSALSSNRERPLFPTIRQRLTLRLSKSLAVGNSPDVLLVPTFHQFYEILNSTFTLSPRCVNVLVNQSADCSCTWMPKCQCRVSAVGVECGSEVVEPRLHILNLRYLLQLDRTRDNLQSY